MKIILKEGQKVLDIHGKTCIIEEGDYVSMKGDNMKLVEGSREIDMFFEFLNYDKRTYYHQGDTYDTTRTLKSFLGDVRDYECNLWLVGYDSGNYSFVLGTSVDKEHAVLEDFNDMMMESGRYEYDENGETDFSLDTITKLNMDKFITVTWFSLDSDTANLVNKNAYSIKSVENELDNIDWFKYNSYRPVYDDYSVLGFIEWCKRIDDNLIKPKFELLNASGDELTFRMIDKFETRYVTIEAIHGQYLNKSIYQIIYEYIINERNK